MEKMAITQFDLETDLPQITAWETHFKDHPNYQPIQEFILENSTYYGLQEVIQTNYEFFHIGDDERKHCLAIKDENNSTIGFILACSFNESRNHPELILQYIVLSPEHQSKGLGTLVLSELLNNPIKYFNTNITEAYCNIHKNNQTSINLFKKFGFSFCNAPMDYVRAHKKIKILEDDNYEQKQQ